MKDKKSYISFVNAVRARGNLPHFDLGGGVDLAQGAIASPQSQGPFGQNTTTGGLTGFLTPQSNFQAQLAPQQYSNYQPVAQQGANTAETVAQQLLAEGQGQGPNPAQAQLAQNTAANVAAQGALQAGQRGASSNVGLIAKQAAQQGSQIQQQAAGQAATLQAQQELAAQQNAANLGLGLFGTAAGAQNAQNQAATGNYGQAQSINAATAAANAAANQGTAGGLYGGLGAALSAGGGGGGGGLLSSLFAKGGAVQKFDDGGTVLPGVQGATAGAVTGVVGPQSFAGQQLSGGQQQQQQSPSFANTGPGALEQGLTGLGAGVGKAGKMIAMAANKGGPIDGELLAAKGQMVPGKAKVKGDSLKNDHVPAMLSPGEIVIPRSIAQAPNAPSRAASFVQAVQAKQGLKRK